MVIRKENVEGYRWGAGCEAWPLLETATLSIKQEQMPAGSSEQWHYHGKAQQFFYILKGAARMETEQGSWAIKAGEGIHVAAGCRHRIVNETSEDLHFLVISEPPATMDRTETQAGPGTSTG
jgi:mannose-6-phosphate isomerase-like protein (cupin superfamily)